MSLVAARTGPNRFALGMARIFIATTIICVAWSVSAAEVLKFGYILSPQSQLGQGATVFASEIEQKTGGRYKIQLFPDAMLGGEVEMLKGIQLGTIDLAFITGAPLSKVLPEVGVFNIPFLFNDAADARALLDGPLGDEYLHKFDRIGMTALAWGENGMRELTNSKRPMRSPEDIVGLKLRLPQSDIMAAGFRALGVDVRQIAFPEVYAALQSGQVDGEENPIATILSSKFAQVQTFLTLTNHVYDPAVILMSKDAFDMLSEADKSAFKDAARAAGQRSRKAAFEANETGIAALRAAGMMVTTDIDRAAFARKVDAAAPYYDAQFGHDVIEKIRTYRVDRSSGGTGSKVETRP